MKEVYIYLSLILLIISVPVEAKKKKYPNGDYYEGEWKNNQPNGFGKMFYANGDVFEGLWISGLPKEGKIKYSNGNFFSGTFDYGYKFEGKQIYSNGDIYEGAWITTKHGGKSIGKQTYANGNVFEGTWNGDQFENGTYKTNDSVTYKGNWKNEIFNGKATTISNGILLIFDGIVRKDSCFSGTLEYQNQATKQIIAEYTGILKEFKRNGQGELIIHDNNIIITGEWENDNLKFGHGSLEYQNYKIKINLSKKENVNYTVAMGYPSKSKTIMHIPFEKIDRVSSILVNQQIRTSVAHAEQEKRNRELQAAYLEEQEREHIIAEKSNSFQAEPYIWNTADIRHLYNQNEVRFNNKLNGNDLIISGIIEDFSIGSRTGLFFKNQVYLIYLDNDIIIWTYDSHKVGKLSKGEQIYILAEFDGERTQFDELYFESSLYKLLITYSIQDMQSELCKVMKNIKNETPILLYENLKLVKRENLNAFSVKN